ncbi:adenosylcobinamide-GDP ribazoletransferase [Paenibacillus methanolicus]|uniref:Adenosylcobinamide-GDP ribazoletransferase n=1 Tax=Paenibacillus methanolicus TaxID=582686 RepID=A0A5S5CH49_9BACL|nr:adenosylcobinamide-GDP ribazoletransferase [Paenibacillus methanolicus]TYP77556.1 adenosylcobinamide-phosphate synthase/adenosylcobinamide-GDP ribazoletransferase [Paenibacillus methanolicus]
MADRSFITGLQAIGAAFQLLTRIPVPAQIPFTPSILARSVTAYPLVGLAVGLLTAGAGWLLQGSLPSMPAAVLMLVVWIAISGALHLDGLMDTADGVLSHRSRERMLEIMKDSRVGAMGVIAAIAVLLFKFSLLAELLEGDALASAAPHIAAACMWSRLWMAFAMVLWPNARGNEGLGGMFAGVARRHIAAALLAHVILLFGVYALFGYNLAEAGGYVVEGGALTLVVGGPCGWWLSRKLGGLTGDTYGAMNELLEAALLLAACAILL